MCPLEDELTEECFQKMPLEFDQSKHSLLWNNGTRLYIDGIFVSEGTNPKGSTWARNPIPRINDDNIGLHDPKTCPGPNGNLLHYSHSKCLENSKEELTFNTAHHLLIF